ncbi:MAG TPA: nicotinate-nucleotide--dimethylbenzimidazole phosphoribosyltransferase [Gemmatimonadaceae bacterium]|nr:nicotinate-nucleotide--dimethylbenzimidazole phosphoribosyltransferase [Gemmatimonadaceae bacterium]
MTQPIVDTLVARRAIDAKTKPLGALGRLEDVAVRLAVLQGTLMPSVDRTRVCVFGADHGIATEGVSAYPRAVTAEMMRNFDRGGAAINVIAAANDVSVEVIDVGVDADLTMHGAIRHEKVRHGSRNVLDEPAMTAAELGAALAVGRAAARRAVTDGVRALGLGEMGIGNTTIASALLSALSGQPGSMTVGRGTGVSDDVLARKREIVDRAAAHHCSNGNATRDARELLRCLGGLELAAIAGAALEAAQHRVAVVVDGFISTVAVLCAARMAAADASLRPVAPALFFAHHSTESGHGLALDAFATLVDVDARPLLHFDMRLGEGSGAALAMPILRAAAAVMRDMATFESAGVSAGDHAHAHRG